MKKNTVDGGRAVTPGAPDRHADMTASGNDAHADVVGRLVPVPRT